MSKRSFEEIRSLILKNLKEPLSIAQIAKKVNCDLRTAKRQLTWLLGEEKIEKFEKNKRIFYTKK